MPWRFLFLLLGLLGTALGGWLLGPWGAAAGIAAGAGLWLAWNAWCSARLLAGLRRGELASVPALPGLWGEVLTRTRRLLRAQQRMAEESEARLQAFLAALQATPNGVLLLDAGGHIEWCNQQAAQHFGLDAQRDRMQSIGHLLREPAFSAYLAAGDYAHDVQFAGHASTPAHPVQLSVQLHPYGDGRRLMLSRDITAVQQADAMRRDFVANVSHEIRTPLTVLTGFVETLQTLPLQEAERQRYLGLMAQQAARMQHLVQDLLTLSRLEGSPWPGLQEWTPVRQLLAHCEQEARALSALVVPAGAAPQILQFPSETESADCGEIAGHAAELQSALSNLVTNAVRYTPPGGQITVQWRPQADGGACFSVRDTGPGIAAEHLPRLTERFYRVDRSRSRESGGTGLGLAIAKHALQRHGAQLRITSTLGQGTEFSVDFPASRLRAA